MDRDILINYIRFGKCHLRALSNVNSAAATEAFALRLRHDQSSEMFAVLNKHEDGVSSKVFYPGMSHWVALQKKFLDKTRQFIIMILL